MATSREDVSFPVRPDDWDTLAQLERMVRARGWQGLTLHISSRDSRVECEASSVEEARDSPVGRRGLVSALTMTFSAEDGGREAPGPRTVQVETERSCSGRAQVAGPDDIEVAGLARRIEELGRRAGRGGPGRPRWRRLVGQLSSHAPALFLGTVSGIAATVISVWFGLS